MMDHTTKGGYGWLDGTRRGRRTPAISGFLSPGSLFLLIPLLAVCLLLSSCDLLLRMPDPAPTPAPEPTRDSGSEEETDPGFDDEWDPSEIRDDSGDVDEAGGDGLESGGSGGEGTGTEPDDVGAGLIPADGEIISQVSGVLIMSSAKSFQSLVDFYLSAMDEIGAREVSLVRPVDGLWNYVGSYGAYRTITINLRDDGARVYINVTW